VNLKPLAVTLLAGAAFAAQAQTFPYKPITNVVPASPGGAIDITARLIGVKLTAAQGQPVNIENKGGASGMLGTEAVAKATPDGHILALVQAATRSIRACTRSCRSTR
jgi:tripartite-type tricarboxylate transporter receptor subunit TctC